MKRADDVPTEELAEKDPVAGNFVKLKPVN